MKNKKFLILVVIALLIITIVGVIIYNAYANNKETTYGEKNIIEKFVKIWGKSYENNSPNEELTNEYIKLYKTNLIFGESTKSAITNATETIVEREALFSVALKKNLNLTDDEFNENFKESLLIIKEAENYDEIEKLYLKQGISFEDAYKDNSNLYKKGYAIDNLEEEISNKYFEKEKKSRTDYDQYLKTEKNKIIAEFKKTDDYKILQDSISAGIDIIDKNDNISVIPFFEVSQ